MTIKLFHRRARGGASSSAAGATARVLAAGVVGMSGGGAGPATTSRSAQAHRPHVEHLEGRQMLAVDITVNTMQRFQPIDGFGSSIASYNGSVYTSAWADMFYQDLGASILRMDLNVNAL